MKHIVLNQQKLNYLSYVIVTMLLMTSLISCSKNVHFIPSTIVPAADGTVKVKKDQNGNFDINVSVENLADPSRLETPKEHYIVWVETESNGTQNLGSLVVNSGLFTNSLSGSLETVTPYRPVQFFITAEDRGNIQYPGMTTVLKSERYKRYK